MKSAVVALIAFLASQSTYAIDFFQCHSELNSDYANIVRVNIDTEIESSDADGHVFVARQVRGAVGRTGFTPAEARGTANDDGIDLILVRDDIIVGSIKAQKVEADYPLRGKFKLQEVRGGKAVDVDCVHHVIGK